MQPTFLVIGAAKCGTTTLCHLLGSHPDVFITDPKEPHHYSRITRFESRRDWYRRLFSGAGDCSARGEGSTSYTHPHRIDLAAPRIASELPECRLIYIVRHPVRRLESDWRMRRLEGRVPESIGLAADRSASLLTLGLYWKNLQVYRELFRDEQILVVFLEDLAGEPADLMERVYRHVGVDPGAAPGGLAPRRNTAGERRRGETAASIKSLLPGIDRLKPILPEGLVAWGLDVLSSHRGAAESPEWDEESHAAVVRLLADDARRLLEYAGKPVDFWSWTRQPEV